MIIEFIGKKKKLVKGRDTIVFNIVYFCNSDGFSYNPSYYIRLPGGNTSMHFLRIATLSKGEFSPLGSPNIVNFSQTTEFEEIGYFKCAVVETQSNS